MLTQLKQKIRKLNHRRIDAGRHLALFLSRLLFDREAKLLTPESGRGKVLVVRLDGKLGDCITSTGFIEALRDQIPGSQVFVLCPRDQEWFFLSVPGVHVISIKEGILGTLKAWWWLRTELFETVVNTSTIMKARTVFLISQARAAKKVSFACSEYKLFSHHANFDINATHVLVRYQSAFEQISGQRGSFSYHLNIPEPAIKRVQAELTKKKILGGPSEGFANKGPMVVINCFAGARARNLSRETAMQVMAVVRRVFSEAKLVFIGNSGDMEILKEWAKSSREMREMEILPEHTDFWSNMAILNSADIVISPDTAIVHAASALKKKLIAIYRPDLGAEKNAEIWAPLDRDRLAVMLFSDPSYFSRGELDINAIDMVALEKALDFFASNQLNLS